jgi:hypothetical protein
MNIVKYHNFFIDALVHNAKALDYPERKDSESDMNNQKDIEEEEERRRII